MMKEFLEKIQNSEESSRRRLLAVLTVVSACLVLTLGANQIKSIFEKQNEAPKAGSGQGALPSVQDNLKSSARELWGTFSDFNSYLESEIASGEQQVTPVPSPAEELPPAAKLPTE